MYDCGGVAAGKQQNQQQQILKPRNLRRFEICCFPDLTNSHFWRSAQKQNQKHNNNNKFLKAQKGAISSLKFGLFWHSTNNKLPRKQQILKLPKFDGIFQEIRFSNSVNRRERARNPDVQKFMIFENVLSLTDSKFVVLPK